MPSLVPEILAAQFANGVLSQDVPAGYFIQPAPRRAARGRSGEIFFTALSLQARTPLPASELDRLAHLMAQGYFGTAGSGAPAPPAKAGWDPIRRPAILPPALWAPRLTSICDTGTRSSRREPPCCWPRRR